MKVEYVFSCEAAPLHSLFKMNTHTHTHLDLILWLRSDQLLSLSWRWEAPRWAESQQDQLFKEKKERVHTRTHSYTLVHARTHFQAACGIQCPHAGNLTFYNRANSRHILSAVVKARLFPRPPLFYVQSLDPADLQAAPQLCFWLITACLYLVKAINY